MANGIITTAGSKSILNHYLTGTTPTIQMGLIIADPTWAVTTVLGNLTVATFTGYSIQNTASWTTPSPDSNSPPDEVSTANVISWTNSGSSQVIYGWYYYGYDDSVLLGGGLFDATITMTTGLTLSLTPTLQTVTQFT